jgi:hypothetical protein
MKMKHLVITEQLHEELKSQSRRRGMVLQALVEQLLWRGLRRKTSLQVKEHCAAR